MGSEDACALEVAEGTPVDELLGEMTDDPEEVRLLGVEAAVEVASEFPQTLLEDTGVALEPSGRLADIQGWFKRSSRLGRSLGLTLRHLRMISWHSCVSRVRNRTSALQIASSFS